MSTTQSADGTTIDFDKLGEGPAVVLVGGVLGDRSQQAPVAELLASRFTVFNYDRRGHGASGFTEPYAVEREIEDLAAVIAEAGGSACVYGTSGCGILALEAAAHGVAMAKLAVWETPYIVSDSRPVVPAAYREQLVELLAQDRRGDMVELFLTKAVGLPAEFVAPMRQAPFWASQEEEAHTLIYDAAIVGDHSLPAERLGSVAVPTVVIDGGTTPWVSESADRLAEVLPNGERRTLAGQPHNVAPDAIAPAIEQFFAG
jgi:pimeloyl-ACP methyl ester carboxylesterase